MAPDHSGHNHGSSGEHGSMHHMMMMTVSKCQRFYHRHR